MMIAMLFLAAILGHDDGIAVGPDVGKPIPDLKTLQVVGNQNGKEINWKTESNDKPTIFVFIKSDKWDRPVARFLKKLDEGVQEDRQKQLPQAALAIIWVTKDTDKAKEYLPRAQQSLKLQTGSWNIFTGEVYDIQGWVLSGDTPINIVIVKDNKVTWGRSYQAVNETLVRPVRQALTGEKK